MIGHQYLVGGISLLLGLFSLGASIKNDDWFFGLAKLQLLQAAVGRSWSRGICGAIGCGLILLGICIVMGWLPRKSSASRHAGRIKFDCVGVGFAC